MLAQVKISSRFNGPLESGNGGYCAGVFSQLIDEHAAVNLRRPIPLDAPLDVAVADGGARILSDGELIAEAQPASSPQLEAPAPVGIEQARAAARRYRGPEQGLFSRCFVCGRGREDSFSIFAGKVEGRRMVASPWTPPEWTAGEDGAVRSELVWAALDCPASYSVFAEDEVEPLAFLVRLNAELLQPVPVGREHVAVGWPAGRVGRKHHAGSAVFGAGGELLAVAEALLVEPA